jgi:hypothetical protein
MYINKEHPEKQSISIAVTEFGIEMAATEEYSENSGHKLL